MSNERDELVTAIMQHPWLESFEEPYTGLCPECPGRKIHGGHNSPSHAGHLADAILAAGWRKPRQITTVEELDALLDRSIVSSGKHAHISISRHDGNNWWLRTGTISVIPSEEVPLPATVLHEAVTA